MAALAFAVIEQWSRRPGARTLPVEQATAGGWFQRADVARRQRRQAVESRPLSRGDIGFNCVRTFN